MGTKPLTRNRTSEISLISDQPITIPLSVHQQARFAAFRADAARIAERQNDAVTTIIAASHDPAALAGWDIRLSETEIICTPPAKPDAA